MPVEGKSALHETGKKQRTKVGSVRADWAEMLGSGSGTNDSLMKFVSDGFGPNSEEGLFTLLTNDLRRPLMCWLLRILPLSPLIRAGMRAAVIVPPLVI